MKGHGEKLSRKQEQALVALLEHPTITQAAKACGIGETTLFRWLQITEFNQEYNNAKRQLLSQSITRLQQASNTAVNTLISVMTNQDSPPSSRVTAAKTVLEMAIKAVEVDDLAKRIDELEELIGSKKAVS